MSDKCITFGRWMVSTTSRQKGDGLIERVSSRMYDHRTYEGVGVSISPWTMVIAGFCEATNDWP